MTEAPNEEQATADPNDRLQIYVDCARTAEALCRAETKETLVLAIADNIAWMALDSLSMSPITIEEAVSAAMERVRECRRSARANNQLRRFERTIERIRAGTYKPPRRRKRRKAKRKVAS
ncbi:MAG: hypothetical protein E6R08_04045 [Nevskiaceae bacterium]|nr:MAG: hypothetical protein E6R08_04045 [Nevskiaceae bacterium]